MSTVDEIKEKMVEHRHYYVTRDTVQYRWDYGDFHAHDEFYCGSEPESEWVKRKRNEAAHAIFEMAREVQP
jgi:hypothetical protein